MYINSMQLAVAHGSINQESQNYTRMSKLFTVVCSCLWMCDSFYWSTTVLMTICEVPHPETNSEFVFMIVDLLSGVLIIAMVIGNVGSMIANTNVMRTQFQRRLDAIKHYLTFRKVRRLRCLLTATCYQS